jgi:hypothetical protein
MKVPISKADVKPVLTELCRVIEALDEIEDMVTALRNRAGVKHPQLGTLHEIEATIMDLSGATSRVAGSVETFAELLPDSPDSPDSPPAQIYLP